ncbi:HAD-IIIC family phosphatase [Paraburkholderia sp. MMS20-SJTR3]|uniref:HAD-IIIC family phosphatase n=1 Tax=Paraburkholderia sejongensis TaxID=2886946 RepID=A0ABS8K488_9BURK|nr:HAD-IIIC family phosphatase [Paraburkholderia sp. MMS20-SJTR3]MCC8396979.1 HAD-IIIC family phosphatase [Paraburkholderia sp. MMS20-SJTR3]
MSGIHVNTQTEEFVDSLYNYVLGRKPDRASFERWVSALESGTVRPHEAVAGFFKSQERTNREKQEHVQAVKSGVDSYHAPAVLSEAMVMPKRVALLGSCLIEKWQSVFSRYCAVDYLQVNGLARLPERPPAAPTEYGFQVVQLGLRFVLPEQRYFGLEYRNPEDYEKLFEATCDRMVGMLRENMRWNVEQGMLTFVCNFLTPQQNTLGRLMPRYDLRNLVYFVEQLNVRLYEELQKYTNSYVLDINQIASIYGKKYFQDDHMTTAVHHGLSSDFDFQHDQARIEAVPKASTVYEMRPFEFITAVWEEALAMYRTVHQAEAVKLVIMDLDDTLWRGIAAEGALDTFGDKVREGWPVGVMEALKCLKNRGVLLAIASKNSEERIGQLWNDMTDGRVSLNDFSVRKINWRTKVENIEEILREVNVLPKNVLFVDDNPVERASVLRAFPGIRVLGANPYTTRRVLMWAPETQVASITDESSRRTEMMQAQVRRESDRKQLSREDFLASLKIKLKFAEITDVSAPKFARAFELINKTNQFNTTGERWTHDAAVSLFRNGGSFVTFEAEDVYSNYGLVGVVVVKEDCVYQWAMSCRVLGLDVELAALTEITRRIAHSGRKSARARVIETEANYLCRDLFERGGFEREGSDWRKSLVADQWAEHSHIEILEG